MLASGDHFMTRCCLVLFFTVATSFAQTKEPSDAWLMQNYRFAPPPAPGEIRPVSPALGQLQEIQNTTLNILRKANFDGDYEAALAAASQATATAQLIGALTGEFKPPMAPTQHPAVEQHQNSDEAPHYLIAFKDDTVVTATEVWADRLMLHYRTTQGAHEQVRLDRVDWKTSEELNRRDKEEVPVRSVQARLPH
jgi:hypothetical protein